VTRSSRWLTRVGLGRPVLRAWAFYDWANSAFVTTVTAAIFPVYFSSVAAADLPPPVATARFALATTVALTIIALAAPFLRAVADYAAVKKQMLGIFLGLGVLATAGMTCIQQGNWQLAVGLFMLADIGAAGSFIFYDVLLPHVAREEELDQVSTAGYALGYLGGGLLLALNLAWIQHPAFFGLGDATAATRLSFLSVSLWWLLFSLPLFRHVPEPPRYLGRGDGHGGRLLRTAFTRISETFQALRTYQHAFVFLPAFLLHNDGIGTIIRMAAIYGTEIGLPQSTLITAILLVQFIGLPCALLFGSIAKSLGTKPAIFLTLAVYGPAQTDGRRK
jgi:UMF1 family MFS transporter